VTTSRTDLPLSDLPARSSWSRLLSLADREAVLATAEAIAARVRIEPLAPPESGLVLIAVRDGVAGVPFHLGEMPAARVALRVSTAEGRIGEGGAIVQNEDLELARATALLDAVLAHALPGWEDAVALLRAGARRAAEIEERRTTLLARTRVDFRAFSELAGEES